MKQQARSGTNLDHDVGASTCIAEIGLISGKSMTARAFYSATIKEFLGADDAFVLGQLVHSSAFDVEATQRDAWLEEIRILKSVLARYARRGKVYLEYSVPRLGKRIDAVVVVDHVVFVLEYERQRGPQYQAFRWLQLRPKTACFFRSARRRRR